MTPTISIAVLMYWVSVSLTSPAMMDMPAVGAGAGVTGGANAIGELLAGNDANHSAFEANVRAREDAAAERAAAQAEPRMVRPESLEQGFIIVVEDVARQARKDVPIYLAGSINQWAAEDPSWQLEPRSDTRWQIEITPEKMGGLNPTGISFKFTMGGWDREELTADGAVPGNRTLPLVDASRLAPGEKPIIELSVPQFRERDLNVTHRIGTYRDLDVTGRVVRLQVAGGAGDAAGAMRDLQIWMPPAEIMADAPAGGFPVLYMFDGQNLFDPENAPAGWDVDEAMSRLIASGDLPPMIVVGIPNSEHRLEEYLPPTANGDRAMGSGMMASGDRHLDWVLTEVMPRVESALPVSTRRDHTGIGGASLGAVMALYAGARHPDRFGLVLAESPTTALRGDEFGGAAPATGHRWRLDRVLAREIGNADAYGRLAPTKAVISIGQNEIGDERADAADANRAIVERVRILARMLEPAGTDVELTVDPNGTHSEAIWGRRFPDAVRFLYGG